MDLLARRVVDNKFIAQRFYNDGLDFAWVRHVPAPMCADARLNLDQDKENALMEQRDRSEEEKLPGVKSGTIVGESEFKVKESIEGWVGRSGVELQG